MKRILLALSLLMGTGSLWAGSLTISAPSSGGTPGGTNTQLQYNNANAFGGAANTAVTASSVTFYEPIVAGGLSVSSGVNINMPSAALVSSFTLTSSMTVVLASAPAGGAWITLTLPDATANAGLDMMIYKVNASTTEVRIQAGGADLIESTGTLFLDAPFQHASLHSLGAAGWGSGLGGIQYTPPRLKTYNTQQSQGFGAPASSAEVICPIYVPVPVTVTGFAWPAGATAQVAFGLLDRQGNIITSTGPIVTTSGARFSAIPTVPIAPGQYYVAVWIGPTTGNVLDGGSNNNSGAILGCSEAQTNLVGITATTVPMTSTINTVPAIDVLIAGGSDQQFK